MTGDSWGCGVCMGGGNSWEGEVWGGGSMGVRVSMMEYPWGRVSMGEVHGGGGVHWGGCMEGGVHEWGPWGLGSLWPGIHGGGLYGEGSL